MRLSALNSKKPRGILVGSMFAVDKINGYALKFRSKVRNDSNELEDVTVRDLIQGMIDDGCFDKDENGRDKGLLIMPNNKKREGKKDPDYFVYAYPSQASSED